MANLNQIRVEPSSAARAARPPGGDALPLVELPVVRKRGRNAFTLVELLVVVAIIAILAALLSPALRSARERSKQIRCMSSMRQLTTALNMYAEEHEGWMPSPNQTMDGVANTPWLRVLTAQKYLGGGNIVYGTATPPPVELQVGRCPAWTHAAWSRLTIYGFRTHSTGEFTRHNLTQVNNLSEFGLVFDTISHLAGYVGMQSYRINPGSPQRIHLRHLGRTNVGFADGSVRCLSMEELIDIETGNLARYGYGYTTSSYYYSGQ